MENAYQAPVSNIEQQSQEYQTPRIWSLRGRIGRLRFIAYCGLMPPILVMLGILFGLIIPLLPPAVARSFRDMPPAFVGIALFVVVMLFIAYFAVRRLRDMSYPIWLSLLMLVPYIGTLPLLLLIFKAGDEGENRHGLPPAPNGMGVIIGAILTSLLFISGMLKNASR
ncbi:DUF805 domain-containing protein [Massilia sp. W12]|uniref:DUF805 domain-containing protein n=1 Tax=Massilia sp. W12 TaxID=3126507 RepID=UPI0030CD52E4